eukprot:CAMPEP_0204586514 /NCGR_PEP_ID=MMETSP0661-20131031/47539_1 /ASSEMBLY_ACC=CAM_ASM_000606 /TAXON_ID=109239 /ORGANISM="Alexandrium margalefi, Strain AMGDE01CS-322" /LENGTH=36 /DNA_ID= /DNA_START= /DNA_END= /DNA_ORIENTATION=
MPSLRAPKHALCENEDNGLSSAGYRAWAHGEAGRGG